MSIRQYETQNEKLSDVKTYHPISKRHILGKNGEDKEASDALLCTLYDIQVALRSHTVTTDQQLTQWVEDVDKDGNTWCKTRLSRLLVQKRHGDSRWGVVVFKWLLESAQEDSWWTPELVTFCLIGWPFLFLETEVPYHALQMSPKKIIEGFNQVLEKRPFIRTFIPTPFIEKVVEIGDSFHPNDRILCVRFLRLARSGEARWIRHVLEWLNDFEMTQKKYVIVMLQELILGWPIILGVIVASTEDGKNSLYHVPSNALSFVRRFFSRGISNYAPYISAS